MAEQRRVFRRKVLAQASISAADGTMVTPVTVRDLSDGGARIAVADGARIPDELILQVPARHINRRGRVVWRRNDEAGLSFDVDQSDGLQQRLRALEDEVARLRHELAELRPAKRGAKAAPETG